MKVYRFGLAVALGCMVLTSFAQAQIQILSGTPTPAPRLVGVQTEGAHRELKESARGLFDSSEAPNPFDFQAQRSLFDQPETNSQFDTGATDSEASHQLPTGKRQSPVDTILENAGVQIPVSAMSGQLAHNYFAPNDWNYSGQRAPSHIAEYMMKQWCADNLWDNYSAERAAQCAKQYQRVSGARHHRCGICGQAEGCQSAPCAISPCSSGQCQAPINRYIQPAPSIDHPAGCQCASQMKRPDPSNSIPAIPSISQPQIDSATPRVASRLPWEK